MRKGIAFMMILSIMITAFIFNPSQSTKYMAEEDEIIELHSYIKVELV